MNKNPAFDQYISKVLLWIAVIQIFLLPLFFLPTTYEVFEFNKLYLFMTLTAMSAIAWSIKILVSKKVYVVRSALGIPLLILLISFTLSTIASLNLNTSMFGSYTRWFPSLFAVCALVFYYYLLASNLNNISQIRKLLFAFSLGSTISAVVTIVNYFGFGVFKNGPLAILGFNTLGSSATAAMIYGLTAIISLGYMLSSKKPHVKTAFGALFTVSFVAAVLTGTLYTILPSAVALIITVAVLVLKDSTIVKSSKTFLIPMSGVLIAFLVAFAAVPQTKDLLQNYKYPKEKTLSNSQSWIIASTTIRDFPLLGSGVSTFYLNYPRYKTVSQNSLDTWNVVFDKPSNFIFEIISTLGLVGLLAYSLLLWATLKVCFRSIKDSARNDLTPAILSGALMFTWLSFFFYYQTFTLALIQFTLLALISAYGHISKTDSVAKKAHLTLGSTTHTSSQGTSISESVAAVVINKEVIHYFFAIPVIIMATLALYATYRQYMPEYLLRHSLTMSNTDINEAYNLQYRAVMANPKRSEYHRIFANTNLSLVQLLGNKESLTEEEKATVQSLLAQTVRSVKYATEVANPLDVANWQTRAEAYSYLIPIAKDSDTFALQAYNTAIQLDPTNATLRLALGGLYYQKEDYLSAGNLFKQATNLKPDYANARYNLAQALIKLNDLNNAKSELEIIMQILDKDSEDYKKVAKEIEDLNGQVQVAGAQTEDTGKPSVEELNLQSQEPTTNQEPLNTPDEAQIEPTTPTQPEVPGEDNEPQNTNDTE